MVPTVLYWNVQIITLKLHLLTILYFILMTYHSTIEYRYSQHCNGTYCIILKCTDNYYKVTYTYYIMLYCNDILLNSIIHILTSLNWYILYCTLVYIYSLLFRDTYCIVMSCNIKIITALHYTYYIIKWNKIVISN